MVTSEDLRFFNVLDQSASLAEATRKTDVTPLAVTQRLRALEAQIGRHADDWSHGVRAAAWLPRVDRRRRLPRHGRGDLDNKSCEAVLLYFSPDEPHVAGTPEE